MTEVNHISIRFIPHAKQRYDTLGDYWIEDDTLHIRASPSEEGPAFLVALHELCESWLCLDRGISFDAIDAHDLAYTGDGEPGSAPASPYAREHSFATAIETLMAHEMGLINYGEVR